MDRAKDNHFDHFERSAAGWDAEPRRIELARGVGAAILEHVRPTPAMDVLDYGCGTGLVGMFLLPHVRSVTGADNSPAMLKVLADKIQADGLQEMRALELDLTRNPAPASRYHLIVSSMVAHHVADVASLLKNLRRMLHPGGALAVADLDAEPGKFHSSEAAATVHHHGFGRQWFKQRLTAAGFDVASEATAHVIRKQGDDGNLRDFPVFLIVGHNAGLLKS